MIYKSQKELDRDQATAISVAGVLSAAGYKTVDSPKEGKFSILLPCGIKLWVGINGKEAYLFSSPVPSPVPGYPEDYSRVSKIVARCL